MDNFTTPSLIAQKDLEDQLRSYDKYYDNYLDLDNYNGHPLKIQGLVLDVESIINCMTKKVNLSMGFESLDASHIWIPYWTCAVLDLFNTRFVYDNRDELLKLMNYFIKTEQVTKKNYLLKCANSTYLSNINYKYIDYIYGDKESIEFKYFCGSYGHTIQLGSFYMGIYNLYLIQSPESLKLLYNLADGFYTTIMSLKNDDGSFRIEPNGETDTRSIYIAISSLYLINRLDIIALEGVFEYLAGVFNYDYSIGPEFNCEAHGGYIYCCTAILKICMDISLDYENNEALRKFIQIKIKEIFTIKVLMNMLFWLTNKFNFEFGGFQGRTNKLIDSCYTYWQGSSYNNIVYILKTFYKINNLEFDFDNMHFIDLHLSLKWVYFYCQNMSLGMIRDKLPNKGDIMHTCLGLAGSSQFLNKIGDLTAEIPEYKSEFNMNKYYFEKFFKLIRLGNLDEAVKNLKLIEQTELEDLIKSTETDL